MTTKGNEVSGMFITQHKLSNMDMERIVVSEPAILKILELIKLPADKQSQAVEDMVDRTPEYMELDEANQIEKIKSVLTQETVVYYLQGVEAIRDLVDVLEVGYDEEGSIVVYAYYTNMNRASRRQMQKAMSEDDKAKMARTILGLDQIMKEQGDNIIDLAQKRLQAKNAKKNMVKKARK